MVVLRYLDISNQNIGHNIERQCLIWKQNNCVDFLILKSFLIPISTFIVNTMDLRMYASTWPLVNFSLQTVKNGLTYILVSVNAPWWNILSKQSLDIFTYYWDLMIVQLSRNDQVLVNTYRLLIAYDINTLVKTFSIYS